LAVRHNPRGIQGKNVSHCHEYAYVLYPSDARKYIGDRRLETPDVRNLRDSGLESDRGDARNCFYPIVVRDGAVESAGDVPTDEYHPPGVNEAKPDGSCFVWPVDTSGREKKWRYARQSVESIFPKLQVRETNGKLEVYFAKDTGTVRTIWDDARFDASEYGTKLLQAMFGTRDLDFSYPKSVHTLIETVRLTTTARSRDCVADYFAGSGTTAHAVIEANRDPEEPGNRTYVVVEMADYFDTVLLPRIKRVVYSNDWKDGRPVSRQGSSHVLKYIRLESYEDTLENLELSRTAEQQLALDVAGPEAREEYLLSYMLKMEAQGSQSLLNLDSFRQPFDYKLKVGTGVAGETRTVNVDLVETFNYLIGLTVRHIDMIRGVRVVEGTSPKGDRVLVLWRDMEEVDNDALDAWFEKQGYSTRDLEYDLIYVNGDNNLENLRRPDQTWKVRLIEPDFHRLMFDAQDV
jgi:adenine-specific DNA-methyltransferase